MHFFPLVLCLPIGLGDALADAKERPHAVILVPVVIFTMALGLFAIARLIYMKIGF